MKDVWRFFHPDTNDFTYIDPSTGGINSRIDVVCMCVHSEKPMCNLVFIRLRLA